MIRLKHVSAAVAASFMTLGLAGQALAHAHLKSAVPAERSAVTAPGEIDLTFSEELNLKFTGITVTGPDGNAVKLGDAMLMDGDKTFMVSVDGKLADGVYKVEWHALSQDGHKTKGSYSFIVKP